MRYTNIFIKIFILTYQVKRYLNKFYNYNIKIWIRLLKINGIMKYVKYVNWDKDQINNMKNRKINNNKLKH